MSQDYLVLQQAPRPVPGALLKRQGGAAADGPPTVHVEALDSRQAAERARDPEVAAIAPVMPTRLIEPMDKKQPMDAGCAWGVVATGADRSPCDGAGVKVAVLDTGIDASHPAFAHVTIHARDFSGSGDGDRQGHGTHCAGSIFGRDAAQRIGIAPGISEAWIGKVLDDQGRGSSDMVLNALHWAIEQRVHIISMSLGFDFPGMVEQRVASGWPAALATSVALEAYRGNLRMFDAIMAQMRALSAFGGSPLVIAAAGNESRRQVDRQFKIAASLPAAAQDVISVAALRREGEKYGVADFSNSFATVSAPGQDIVSAKAKGGLVAMSGTSMACPYVAGIAALWWQSLGARADAARVASKLRGSCSVAPLSAADPADVGDGMVVAPDRRAP